MASESKDGSKIVDIEELRKDIESRKNDAYNFTYQNGRRYASTELGHYYIPNDEPEIQRLNEQHHVLTQVRGGNILSLALPQNSGLRILDIGCGTGIWCIQMAEDYPGASIVGMDVSPIQPEKRPSNVEWLIQDMEKQWPFPDEHFDLIHLSLVQGNVADWDEMMQKILKHLASAGYVEHQEYAICSQYMVDTDGNAVSFPPDSVPPFYQWGKLMEAAGEKRGRPINLGSNIKSIQANAGLKDVTEQVYNIKIGTWPENEQERQMGAQMLLSGLRGMEGFSMMLFTKVLGWTVEETQEFVEKVKRDITDDSMRKIMPLYVVHGRKS